MKTLTASDAAKAVVRPNTEDVQGKGNFDVFEELLRTILSITPRNLAITPTKSPAMAVRNVFAHRRKASNPWSYTRSRKENVRMLAELKRYVEAQPK